MVNKIILAIYYSVDNLDSEEAGKLVTNLKERLNNELKENILFFFCPVTDQNEYYRVECVYPTFLVLDDDLKKDFKEITEKIKKRLE